MIERKKVIMIGIALLALAGIALLGGILGKKTAKVAKEADVERVRRCFYDGTEITPLYQVDAYLADDTTKSFCSIYCATQWFKNNKDKVIYLTVVDEVTGQRFDSTLAYFVQSDVVTIPEVKNRIHTFAVEEDALTHARQFNGRLIEDPFGRAFVPPAIAKLDALAIGIQALPDSIPLKLAVYRPIFKENRLKVDVVPFRGDQEGKRLLSEGSVEGIICDLPTGLMMAKGNPPARIVKNILRANPFRAMFAIVAGADLRVQELAQIEGKTIAVPQGVSFRFYSEYYLKSGGVPLDKVVLRVVSRVSEAWDLLENGRVSAALLRTPYTDMAMAKGLTFLADDRSLPWMSVLVLKQSAVEIKSEAIKRFIFALEQSVLALNLKPNEFHSILEQQGGIPGDARKKFPMPIFEGANCPSPSEIGPILEWLDAKGLLSKETPYEEMVSSDFLPNPDDVGLAFCCR